MATIMLVHGGGMGSWSWRYVIPLLRERGHEVFATTMTGSGDRHHLLTSQVTLETNVADVASAVIAEDLTDCVLIGHSQSGAVLPGVNVAIPERLRKLVFLDSILLNADEAIGEAVGFFTPEQCRDMATKVRRGEAPAELDISAQQQAPAELPTPIEPKRLEWMYERLTGIPALAMFAPVQVGFDSVSVPADYVKCTVQPIMGTFHERADTTGWPMHALESDHACMISEPEKTAALLDSLAV
jgi:pimeloyl-ACP methyl ester carboxylesterase